MKIVTYTNEEAPIAFRSVAIILHSDGSRSPVLFSGKTEDDVVSKANAFWASETERFSKIDGRTKEGRAAKTEKA